MTRELSTLVVWKRVDAGVFDSRWELLQKKHQWKSGWFILVKPTKTHESKKKTMRNSVVTFPCSPTC